MTRPVDERSREELLDRVVDYVLAHGVIDLALRPLARAVHASPRLLLYRFTSKDDLLMQVVSRLRERQRELFERVRDQDSKSAVDACRAAWDIMSSPKMEPLFKLFIELYGLALKEPKRYASFLKDAIGDWLKYIEQPFLAGGHTRTDARAIATVVLAGYRGFMLDLCATHDRARIDRAVDVWLDTLGSIGGPRSFERARSRSNAS
ncbi:MAG TPA: TetR/AcrR family transcriptional regulator [Candidatus Eremiobacteraceae bacterium]|nr:TetR/AcrR family transcriptional regulator [Candidatus Eremiobacteraceae bacterium]